MGGLVCFVLYYPFSVRCGARLPTGINGPQLFHLFYVYVCIKAPSQCLYYTCVKNDKTGFDFCQRNMREVAAGA